MKPPKYEQELKFLIPYISDSDNRQSNFAPNNQNEEEGVETGEEECNLVERESPLVLGSPHLSPTHSSNQATDDFQDSSALSSPAPPYLNKSNKHPQKRNRSGTPVREKTAASVLQEFLSSKQTAAQAPPQCSPLESFFISIANTVKGFPIRDQIEIKKKIFQLVSDKEMDIALRMSDEAPKSGTPQLQTPQHQTTQHQTLVQKTGQFPTALSVVNEDPNTLKNYYSWGWQDFQK